MSNLGSTSSDLLIGENFLRKLLYVQHVDEEKDTVSETPDRYLEEYLLADRTDFIHDSKFTKYLKSPKANLSILKLSMKDVIMEVIVYTNPLDIRALPENDVTIHAFVVFKTENHLNHKCTWWSLEKNGLHIVLQQSTNKEDVINKIYDTEKKTSVERLLPIKQEQEATGWKDREVKDLLRTIWDNNQISEPYHIATSNCQHFASFICENTTGERWTTEIVERIGLKNQKIQPRIQVDAFKYKTIVNDEKFDFYRALMEERMEDFEKLIKEMTIESSNSVDSEGNTLLEWATVFSTSHWPIDEDLKKKGATIPSDKEGLFRRNVFFIALQYLPSNKKLKLFDSFDGIDIHGVANKTGDTALHLALNGEKWEIAGAILNRFKEYDVNITNSVGDTPLHLAARLDCEFGLFKKIVNRTNSENVNKTNGNGNTALHYVIINKSEMATKELLARSDVNVDIKNNYNSTALHLASTMRMNFPSDLYKLILEKSKEINAQDKDGWTALHDAICRQSEIMTKSLLAHNDVNVNFKDKNNCTPLHLASKWEYIPCDLFKLILERSTDVINAQNDDGWTALHFAILFKSEIATKELLVHSDVDVNVKNYNNNETALHLACILCFYIPVDLFKLILEKSTDINSQNIDGWTALHLAIFQKSGIATKELLAHSDVNVNVKTNHNDTALIYASQWEGIPVDLYKLILEKSTDVINAQDEYGHTALHWAIFQKSKISTKALLKHKDVDVNVQNNDNETAIDLASKWTYIPIDLFKIILEKSTDINSQNIMGDTALHYAIISKSEIATKELLAHNDVNVNVKNNDHETALHLACKWKDMPMDLFKLTLEKTIDINAKDKGEDTALHYAILHQSKIHVEELLKHKEVNVNVENDIQRTPLHLACYWWKDIPVDLFNLILEKSTNINTHDKDGETALHLAISFKSEIATKELLKHKDVNVKVENKNNETALHLASKWKDIPGDLFKIILEKSTTDTNNTQENVNKTDENGCTALHYAIDNQCEIQLEELLKRDDMDVNVKNNYERIALHLASKWTDIPVDLFKLILEKSTDKNAQDEEGDTALHMAIFYKSEIATKELLAHSDVNVNIKNNNNYTLLHLASYWNDIPVDLFNLILEKSDDINAQNKDGNTALNYAILSESDIMTKELLARDVDVKVKNNDNETGLHFASKWPNIPADLFKLILEKSTDINAQDKDGNTALHYAFRNHFQAAVMLLLAHNDVNVNIKNNDNETALHYASMWTNIPSDLFNLIFKKSTDLNAQDINGWNALHWAISRECEIATKVLLTHEDVDVNVKNNDKETALHLASRWYIPVDLSNLIFKKSKDVNVQDKDGWTALHVAIRRESKIATKELLAHSDVDVKVKNNKNETALHLACYWWKDIPVDFFKQILEKSTDINAQDKNGKTALHCAILGESEIATNALLTHNDVNVNFKDKNNCTPLHLASKWQYIPCDLFKLILEKSTDVINAQDVDGWTALHYAIIHLSEIKTKELLAHNDVNVNVKDNYNRTILHLASNWTDIPSDLFKLILERSTDAINAQDIHGITALHLAIHVKSEIATKELLAHNDVNVNIKNKDHETALSYVSEWEDIPSDLFKLISERSTNDEV